MPHFRLETNVPQDKIPGDFSAKLCGVLSKSLGKPNNYCCATVIGGVDMSWGSTKEPAAQATLISIGALGIQENKKHAKALFECVSQNIDVPADRMYISFTDSPSSAVGYNGTTFHEILEITPQTENRIQKCKETKEYLDNSTSATVFETNKENVCAPECNDAAQAGPSNIPEANQETDSESEPFSTDSEIDPNYNPSEDDSDNNFTKRVDRTRVVRNVFQEVETVNDIERITESVDLENEPVITEKRTYRKRKRTPNKWVRNIRKERRLTGQEYVNRGGKTIEKITMKENCRCRMKCYLKIKEEDRKKIHTKYWDLLSWDQRKQFVAMAVNTVAVSRNRPRNNKQEGRRKNSYEYSLKVNNETINVCKVMFLNTLSVSEKFLRNSIKNINETSITTPDKRQKLKATRIIGQRARDIAKTHIESFPAAESHYSRSSSVKKYLEPGVNIKIMYDLYKEYCRINRVEPNDILKESYYRFIFVTEYNFSFHLPSLDTCDDCDRYQRLLLDAKQEKDKLKINTDRDLHHMDSERRYKNKEEDKQRSRLDGSKEVVCTVDLQKCLPTPCLTNNQSFYKLKLWTLNFTICNMTRNQTSCMIWNESIGKRGSNEIVSCIFKWIASLPEDIEEITFWSDNCAGQNRNTTIMFFYTWILYKFPHIKFLNHKYLLKGHTHMEVDVAHAVIEHKRRHTKLWIFVILMTGLN